MDYALERVLWEGAAAISHDGAPTLDHFPNSVFTLHVPSQRSGPFAAGENVSLEVYSLPIGCEIFRTEFSKLDTPNWDVTSITFGAFQILRDPAPLSVVRCLTYQNGLGVFKGVKSKVDIQVSVYLRCRVACQSFGGFSVFAYQEEQESAIQTRIESAYYECPHLEEDVKPMLYTDGNPNGRGIGGYYGRMSMFQTVSAPLPPGFPEPPKPEPRFFCLRGKREVKKP